MGASVAIFLLDTHSLLLRSEVDYKDAEKLARSSINLKLCDTYFPDGERRDAVSGT